MNDGGEIQYQRSSLGNSSDGGKDRANIRKGGPKFWASLDSKATSDSVTDTASVAVCRFGGAVYSQLIRQFFRRRKKAHRQAGFFTPVHRPKFAGRLIERDQPFYRGKTNTNLSRY